MGATVHFDTATGHSVLRMQRIAALRDVFAFGMPRRRRKRQLNGWPYPFFPSRLAVAFVATAIVWASGAYSVNASGLDFIECTGPAFDPAWAEFQQQLKASILHGTGISNSLATQASNLLDVIEEQDVAQGVATFAGRLRGEPEAEEVLGGFCLYGAVAVYAAIALHLEQGAGEAGMPPTAKSSVARAIMLLAKKLSNDFLESSRWMVRSMDLVAMIEGEDPHMIRAIEDHFSLPCHFQLGCEGTRALAEAALVPPEPPLPVAWPRKVVAIGMHITTTLEAMTSFRDAVGEAWGRGGAGGEPFEVAYAGHPCPSHEGSEHQCQMKCELLGQCGPGADATDPLAEFLVGAVDVARYEEREAYALGEARAALRWAPRRLAPLRQADMLLCTFPTVLCVWCTNCCPRSQCSSLRSPIRSSRPQGVRRSKTRPSETAGVRRAKSSSEPCARCCGGRTGWCRAWRATLLRRRW